MSSVVAPRPVGWFLALLASALFPGAVSLSGQADPPKPKDEEIVVLSPFTVQTGTDVGYEASESLAGNGLKSKLTDLGASVAVVTAKFLEDTASFKLADLMVYQANMEVSGFGGNYSGATPAPGGVTNEPDLGNGPTGTRVRGLAEATQAINFYRTAIPMDGYNTERVEVIRGANALLFGVGSPAGIINTSTQTADLRKQGGSVSLSGGSYGAFRASFNYNLVPERGEFAVRAAAVTNRDKYQQKFAYSNSDRHYVATAWDLKPLRNLGVLTSTTVRTSFEKGRITSNLPRTLTPSDRISSWFDDSLPADLRAAGARGKVGYDPTAGPFNVFTAAARNATIGVPENVNRSPTFFLQSPTATAPRDNIPTTASGQALLGRPLVSNNVYFPSTGLTGTAVGAYSRELSRVRADYGLQDQGFFTAENLTDPSIFDFFNNLIAGPNSQADARLQNLEVSLQQLLLRRQAGFELSFNRQHWEEGYQSLMNQGAPYLSIDVNTRMWTGEVNPNFGRPFISTAGAGSYTERKVDTARAKLFYELNLQERWKNRWGGILGRHVVSAVGQHEVFTTEAHTGGSMFYTPDFWTNGNDQSRRAGQSKQIVTWIYLGPSLLSAASPKGAQLQGVQQNLMNLHQEITGKGVVLSRVPAPNTAVAAQPQYNAYYTPITVLKEDSRVSHTAGSASINERALDSQAVSLQSNWLWDHVVSTVGWRKEASSIASVNAPNEPTGEGYRLIDDPRFSLGNPSVVPQKFTKSLFAWSGVAKVPAAWLRRVPVIHALNLFYSSSENFTPPTTKAVDAFGTEIAPPRGITKEKGVYFEAFNGRITARLNFFETTQTGTFNSTVGGIPSQIMSLYGNAYSMVRGGNLPDGGGGLPAGFVAPPAELLRTFNARVVNGALQTTNPGVTDTSDSRTKGTEFELMFRPTRGLSFVFNVSEQESIRTNTGATVRKLLFDTPTASGKPIAQEWRNDWAFFVPLNVGALPNIGSRTDINMLANNFLVNVLNRFNTSAAGDGAPVQELRRWRANVVANYDFQSERFKGFGIGTGVRWLDEAAIGYPIANFRADLTPVPAGAAALPGDIRISDIHHPFFGPTETRFDGWVSYQRKILRGKVGLKVQLNARNLFTQNKLVPTVINPDGRNAVYAIAEGRKFTLTTRFSF